MTQLNRRTLLALGAASLAGAAMPLPTFAAGRPRLRKAVKFHMIDMKGASVEEKSALIKKIGFDGVEINTPTGEDTAPTVEAAKTAGITIHGVVIGTHWKVRHSDPDPAVREQAMKDMLASIQECKAFGGSTVLLVPGKVTDPKNENFELVWERSTEQVKKAIPIAKQAGVKIAIEVVWNDFLTTSDQLIKYVDQFNDPTVGAYFDCSNMIKYGEPSATWIRKLGKRMLKFDFKGYNAKIKDWVPIGEGTEDWPEILKALEEVGYEGWATAEVKGGGEDRLREIAAQMDKVLGLK